VVIARLLPEGIKRGKQKKGESVQGVIKIENYLNFIPKPQDVSIAIKMHTTNDKARR